MNTSAGWRWRMGVKKKYMLRGFLSCDWKMLKPAKLHSRGLRWSVHSMRSLINGLDYSLWKSPELHIHTEIFRYLWFSEKRKTSGKKSFELKLVLPSLWGCIWAVQSSGPWLDRKRTSPSRCSAPPPSPPTLHLHKTQRRTWSHLDQTADTWRPDWRSEGYEGGLRWCSCAHVLCNT